jgi:hypothetical protein
LRSFFLKTCSANDSAGLSSSCEPSHILSETVNAFSRLRSIFDLGKQLGLEPDAAMNDALAVGYVSRISGLRRSRSALELAPRGPRVAKSKLRPSVLFFSGFVCI